MGNNVIKGGHKIELKKDNRFGRFASLQAPPFKAGLREAI